MLLPLGRRPPDMSEALHKQWLEAAERFGARIGPEGKRHAGSAVWLLAELAADRALGVLRRVNVDVVVRQSFAERLLHP